MTRLCERPGCSQVAEMTYGFDAEHLMVWIDSYDRVSTDRAGVLCRRHADAMVVPLGWMLDDRRDPVPRLFKAPAQPTSAAPRQRRPSSAPPRRHRTVGAGRRSRSAATWSTRSTAICMIEELDATIDSEVLAMEADVRSDRRSRWSARSDEPPSGQGVRRPGTAPAEQLAVNGDT